MGRKMKPITGKREFFIDGLPGIPGRARLRVTPEAVVDFLTTSGDSLLIPKRVERFVAGEWQHCPSVFCVSEGLDTAHTVALTMQDGRLTKVATAPGQPDMDLFEAAKGLRIKTTTVYPEAMRRAG